MSFQNIENLGFLPSAYFTPGTLWGFTQTFPSMTEHPSHRDGELILNCPYFTLFSLFSVISPKVATVSRSMVFLPLLGQAVCLLHPWWSRWLGGYSLHYPFLLFRWVLASAKTIISLPPDPPHLEGSRHFSSGVDNLEVDEGKVREMLGILPNVPSGTESLNPRTGKACPRISLCSPSWPDIGYVAMLTRLASNLKAS